MSRDRVVVRRYARALFEAARDKQVAAQVEEELRLIVDTVKMSPEIGKFLEIPNISSSVKVEVFKQALSGTVSDLVLNTIGLLFERGRYAVLGDLLEAYVKIAGEAEGLANAVVYSVYPLSEEEQQKIAEKFGRLLNKKIRLENIIDKSLLGGIRVRIGDRLYDGSLSGKLAQLEKTLKQAQAL
jgi:F-type H+-transporting ATPase subunit delta